MSPARLLAPAAIAAAAIALFVILVTAGGNDTEQEASPAVTATATPTATRTPKAKSKSSGGTYVVEPGDTPSAIAEREGIDVQDLLEANPDIDPAGLSVGEELKLP